MTKIKDFYGAPKGAPLQNMSNPTFSTACEDVA
jgi:hypothetical protein